jgi:hypothetical protein
VTDKALSSGERTNPQGRACRPVLSPLTASAPAAAWRHTAATHDFLATILGTDRPSVSLAAKLLQSKGIIEYKRGSISILSLRKLENSSCERYRVIQTLDQTAYTSREGL